MPVRHRPRRRPAVHVPSAGHAPGGLPPALDPAAPLPQRIALPGPTGETNTYLVEPRGAVYCVAASEAGARAQWAVARQTGNHAWFADTPAAQALPGWMPSSRQAGILADADVDHADFQAVLFEGMATLRALNQRIAQRAGPILAVHGLTSTIGAGAAYAPERLLAERSVSVNTPLPAATPA